MAFPKRYRQAKCPGYDDLTFRVQANPTGTELSALYDGDTETPERAASLGAMLVQSFGGDKIEGYGVALDFSTPESVITLLSDDAIPIDLRRWIRNAPMDVVSYEREEHAKNLAASFELGK